MPQRNNHQQSSSFSRVGLRPNCVITTLNQMDVKMEATASLRMALLSFKRSLQKLNSASFSKCQMSVKREKTVLSLTVPVNYLKILQSRVKRKNRRMIKIRSKNRKMITNRLKILEPPITACLRTKSGVRYLWTNKQ